MRSEIRAEAEWAMAELQGQTESRVAEIPMVGRRCEGGAARRDTPAAAAAHAGGGRGGGAAVLVAGAARGRAVSQSTRRLSRSVWPRVWGRDRCAGGRDTRHE
jgi:hypothetical protein